jgi:predicted protein tyrosine phosphatase
MDTSHLRRSLNGLAGKAAVCSIALLGRFGQVGCRLKVARTKILFICSRNRRRSLTAETLFKGEPAWVVRSAGTEDAARIKVTAGQLGWADVVVVMEKRHKERLRQKFPEEFATKRCFCFFIPDDYEFMDESLIEILRAKMREHFPAIE